MQWILFEMTDAKNKKGASCSRMRPSHSVIRLLLFGSLVVGVDLLASLVKDALHFSSVGTRGSQRKILLIGFFAIARKNDAVRLRIHGGIHNQALALDVVKDGLVRIGCQGGIGRSNLCGGVAFLEEDDRFIAQVEGSASWIGLGGSVKRGLSLRHFALA